MLGASQCSVDKCVLRSNNPFLLQGAKFLVHTHRLQRTRKTEAPRPSDVEIMTALTIMLVLAVISTLLVNAIYAWIKPL